LPAVKVGLKAVVDTVLFCETKGCLGAYLPMTNLAAGSLFTSDTVPAVVACQWKLKLDLPLNVWLTSVVPFLLI